jgi:hypothetical protein
MSIITTSQGRESEKRKKDFSAKEAIQKLTDYNFKVAPFKKKVVKQNILN